MKAAELKKIQAPIKEKYRKNSDEALITLMASGEIGKGISCKVDTGKAMVEAGLHPATGGTGMQSCSGDLLLEALVACAGVTLSAVATALEFDMAGGRVKAEGDLDFRGTLGVDKEAKVGFKNIRLNFQLSTSESKDRIDKLLKLTERYCVVYQTLVSSTDLVAEIEIM
ncbi:OsmC family protein [Aestuariivivens sp. NBU2969]|uniref:OsmC family protein n=1 Tax=Aestuariivivens sp. NBU2969 TaxID=2873267 RepID=UPI001CBDFF0D|nr:OsmC family protein [Aestuariivivens sp. NBU2969]